MMVEKRISNMARDAGQKSSALGLLGDSEPANFSDRLTVPLDRLHPTRHNIWTPILDVIQAHAFRAHRVRLDDSELYVRNAVKHPERKPRPDVAGWQDEVCSDVTEFERLLAEHKPRLVLCFGSFAWEFARRALGESPNKAYGEWNTTKMGVEFKKSVGNFNPSQVNIFPLLHASIARGRFLESHKGFCGSPDMNYFDFVGGALAGVLLKHRGQFGSWLQ
ncbi:hypothetical protein [Archangium lansingense]|uniref:Uracil DNA glycosylase superfamily protein n=1 Tax=Archangium lansingense TaxID=2995310 RepID=A0ABT3ZUA1_9BACT|nr:hypothetical protein [Archangium lansinium]MCY1072993.1 hypothetical protein [Archangium lansinium]